MGPTSTEDLAQKMASQKCTVDELIQRYDRTGTKGSHSALTGAYETTLFRNVSLRTERIENRESSIENRETDRHEAKPSRQRQVLDDAALNDD